MRSSPAQTVENNVGSELEFDQPFPEADKEPVAEEDADRPVDNLYSLERSNAESGMAANVGLLPYDLAVRALITMTHQSEMNEYSDQDEEDVTASVAGSSCWSRSRLASLRREQA